MNKTQSNHLFVGALIAVVSMAVGAASVLYAQQLTAFSGISANYAKTLQKPSWRMANGVQDNLQRARKYSVVRSRERNYVPDPRNLHPKLGRHQALYRQHQQEMHAAAEKRNTNTVHCEQFRGSKTRYARCNAESRNGVDYQGTQTGL